MELSKEYLAMKEAGTKVVGPPPSYPHGATIFTQEKRDGSRLKRVPPIDPRLLSKSEVAGPAPKLDIDLTLPTAGKKVKHVFIEATFPELKGGASRQSAHGEASGTKPAIARAFKNLLKTIPKKRISVISAKISITTKTVEG